MPLGEWMSHHSVLHSVDMKHSIVDVYVMRCRGADLHTAHKPPRQEGLPNLPGGFAELPGGFAELPAGFAELPR